MSNTLSPELQKQIEQEANDAASSLYSPNNYNEFTSYQAGHQHGAAPYALKWQAAEQLIEQMAKALEIVQKWQLPPTGTFWNDEEKTELKARCDKMEAEHADPNIALAAMLNGYQNLSAYQKDWFTVPKDLIDAYTKMVLEYDKGATLHEGINEKEGEDAKE